MIVSSMELNKQQSKESKDQPLPRYKSIKSNINEETKGSPGIGYNRAKNNNSGLGSARGERNPYGSKSSASKKDTTFAMNSGATAH